MAAISNVVATGYLAARPVPPLPKTNASCFSHDKSQRHKLYPSCYKTNQGIRPLPASLSPLRNKASCFVLACLPVPDSESPTSSSAAPSTKLYVSGLSFRTTEESLRNAFKAFGQLVEVNLVMDKIANRPRGFAFLRYATEEESQKAIEGMHGKFLDGRVIFVEVAKPRSELRQQRLKQNSRF